MRNIISFPNSRGIHSSLLSISRAKKSSSLFVLLSIAAPALALPSLSSRFTIHANVAIARNAAERAKGVRYTVRLGPSRVRFEEETRQMMGNRSDGKHRDEKSLWAEEDHRDDEKESARSGLGRVARQGLQARPARGYVKEVLLVLQGHQVSVGRLDGVAGSADGGGGHDAVGVRELEAHELARHRTLTFPSLISWGR